jgi:hypothetical protein
MLRTRECPDNAQHLFFYHFIYLDAAVSERRHVPCNYRLDPRPKRMDRSGTIGIRKCSRVVSLPRLPDNLTLVLIEFVPESETGFYHDIV